ncbi:MAG: valine--tRNA ligase [Armatimonadetes bacterium]|nr:valine--tRNA ligase [Armatimonadota bacterium]
MTDSNLSTRYDPKRVEERWYERWEKAGLFRPECGRDRHPERPVYCITIPPPNVTGSLHMGHALCYSVQDVCGRWKRMKGYEVLVLPGTDHAGIATQKVIETQLRDEGLSRVEIGRERFLERVWKWKEESGGVILKQFKRLGFAFDWSRERFTMDPQYHDAVLRVFVDWFERGLIYRGKRVINWDPGLRTSVSDIEVVDETRRGKLYHVRYPYADGSGHVVVATTRPETMLADVAVAVHPGDKRYRGLAGKELRLPLTDRVIPLIEDPFPDPEFGSGAVKITPAHDANDFEVGRRMGLDFDDPEQVPVCIGEDARVIAPGTPYDGLDRFVARKRIVEDLEAQGLMERVEDYDVPLKIGDRSGQVIEPLLSEQWFCKMKPLAEPAIEAVKSGRVRIIPERYTGIYLRWMENIRDWCLSRQLWWGHRVPVYYTEAGDAIAAVSQEEAEQKAGGPVTQDPDVLDTWFSSALWPFATLGWPDQTDDLKRFYPTGVLVTARDIIYLWVARMIMDGLDQAGDVPFRDVYIYATVLTEDGKRMSKSLGTGVDPLEYIDRFGADAMRFSLLVQTGHNQEIRFGEKRIEEARNFCNKIWNASRFALMNLEGFDPSAPPPRFAEQKGEGRGGENDLHLEDRWILSRLRACSEIVDRSLQNYNMMDACKALHEFFWAEFCDWYIEAAKSRLQDEAARGVPQAVLVRVLDSFCRLMHPVMPHITEEVWHKLPGVGPDEHLSYADWPEPADLPADPEAEAQMGRRMEIVRAARNLRQEVGITPLRKLGSLYLEGFEDDTGLIRTQSWFEKVEGGRPPGVHISATAGGVDIHLPIEGLVDPARELGRLQREAQKTEKELAGVMSQLNNPQFVKRAKPEIVERDREAAKALHETMAKLEERKRRFEELG